MPRRDGTGPLGNGPMTGKGFGFCNTNAVKYGGIGLGLLGLGYGCQRGYRWFASQKDFSKTEKELLEQRKEILKNQLDQIDKRLEDL